MKELKYYHELFLLIMDEVNVKEFHTWKFVGDGKEGHFVFTQDAAYLDFGGERRKVYEKS